MPEPEPDDLGWWYEWATGISASPAEGSGADPYPAPTRAAPHRTRRPRIVRAATVPEGASATAPSGVAPVRYTYSAEFERAWAIYPRGERKRQAAEKYKRHVDEGEHERVLVAIGHLTQARKPEFCPYAERFFPDWRAWEHGNPMRREIVREPQPEPEPLPEGATEWERARALARRTSAKYGGRNAQER